MAHPSSSSLLSLIPTAVSGGGASTLAGKTARQTFARVENPDIKVVREAPPPAGNSNSIGGSSTSNKNEEGGLSRHQGRSKTSETTSLLKSPNRSGPLGQASEEQHQLSDMSMLHIHPQTPPVPMEHPSHVLPSHSGLSRQRTVSGASSQYSMMSGSALVQNRPEQAHPTLGLVSHPQRKKSSLQKKAQTVRAPRKEGRVASVGSASLPAHGPSGSHMPSMERSRSQPLMGSAHHPQGGMASQRLADGLDPRRVMDPRSRAILDLEPIHDAHLLRLSSQHASRRTLQPLVENKSSSSKPHPPSVLQEPAINSTQLLHHKIQLVRQTKFDPVNAMAQYMSNKESLKAVQDRVTAKVMINFVVLGRVWRRAALTLENNFCLTREVPQRASDCRGALLGPSLTHRLFPAQTRWACHSPDSRSTPKTCVRNSPSADSTTRQKIHKSSLDRVS